MLFVYYLELFRSSSIQHIFIKDQFEFIDIKNKTFKQLLITISINKLKYITFLIIFIFVFICFRIN